MAQGGSSRYRTDYYTEIVLAQEDKGSKKEESMSGLMNALMTDVNALITVLATGGGEKLMHEASSAIEGA